MFRCSRFQVLGSSTYWKTTNRQRYYNGTVPFSSSSFQALPGPIVMKVEPPADNDRPTAPTTLTKSALLLQWVRDSKLLEEELLGERMHQQLLARGTPLLTTMSKYVAAPF
jgi:hypothetical protein